MYPKAMRLLPAMFTGRNGLFDTLAKAGVYLKASDTKRHVIPSIKL
jgi:hypothetical protein